METIASVFHVGLFFWARLVARSIFEDRKWSDSNKILMKCPAPQGGVSSTAEDPLRHSQGHGQLDEVPAHIAVRLGFGLTVLAYPAALKVVAGSESSYLDSWNAGTKHVFRKSTVSTVWVSIAIGVTLVGRRDRGCALHGRHHCDTACIFKHRASVPTGFELTRAVPLLQWVKLL